MSCCGSKRALLNTRLRAQSLERSALLHQADSAPRPKSEANQKRLRYLNSGSLSLRVPDSGRTYQFDGRGLATIVHDDDLDVLLRTELFVIEPA